MILNPLKHRMGHPSSFTKKSLNGLRQTSKGGRRSAFMLWTSLNRRTNWSVMVRRPPGAMVMVHGSVNSTRSFPRWSIMRVSTPLHLKKKTLWDLKKIAGLPIYGQGKKNVVNLEWRVRVVRLRRDFEREVPSECARELFAKYQRLVLCNQYTKVDHHVWVNHFFKGEIERQAGPTA